MSTYDDFSVSRFKNFLAAHKPRAWKQEAPLDMTVYSKPEPTSKTRIPSKNSFTNAVTESVVHQHLG
ncbi:hypothetical protein GCM10011613_11890 [Cellvibrio zantedeschiae]|uniref:Uncharacterized protein n=1 Tax=Cellvibrio zantedeschiae TaxID=1237077 RepID=A0ABQ3AYF5_9GAMM|nr:hypothetical protein [Cellvibrio zantedeschiae]GGY69200.1 hypothetical protein GCM10011613_11890 [Cellvibrio zantedeschiae]